MADGKGLDALIKKMESFHQEVGIKTPNGKSNQEEIQYTEMDMIAGLCSAALFGASNKNKDNFKSLLSNPTKSSYLGQILKHFELSEKYLKEKIFKNMAAPINITNNGALKVHLESINKDLQMPQTPFIVSLTNGNNISTEKSENSNIVSKLLLEIDQSSNLEEASNFLAQLEKINGLENLQSINELVKIFNNINQIPNINSDIIKDISKFIKELSGIDLSKNDTYIENLVKFTNLVDTLNSIPEIQSKDLNIDTIQKISNFIKKLPSIDISQIPRLNNSLDQLSNIDKYILYLNSISRSMQNLSSINFDDSILQKIPNITQALNKIKELTNINFDFEQLDNSNLDKFIDSITEFLYKFKDLNISEENLDPKKISDNIGQLNQIFNDNKNQDNTFSSLFENISKIIDKVNSTNKNIESINTVLKTILFVVNNDQKINTVTLNGLIRITKPGGKIDTLFKQLSELTSEKNIQIEPIRALQTYFSALATLGDIGLIKRMRILNNVKFFSIFINRHLPALIEDINKRFKDVDDINKIPGLYGLTQLFKFISNIGDIPLKHKLRLKFNLMFIRYFILDDVLTMIKDFNETLQSELKDIEIDKITRVFDSLLSIAQIEPEKLNKSQYTLNTLHDLIYKKKYSLIKLLTQINQDKNIYISSEMVIDNMTTVMESLVDFVNNMKLEDKMILHFIKSGTLLRFTELPIIFSIINFINENIKPINAKSTIEEISEQYINPLGKLNTNLLNLDSDYKLIRNIIKNLNKEIKNINNLLILTLTLNESYNKVDKDIFDNINDFLSKIKIKDYTIDNSKVINDLSTGIINLITLLDYLNNIKIPSNEVSENLSGFIIKLIDDFSDINSLEDDVIKKLIISDDSISKLNNFKKSLKIIIDFNNSIKKITAIGNLLKPFEMVLNQEAKIVNTFINGFEKIDTQKIEAGKDVINELSKLMVLSTAVLIIGAMAMQFINIIDLLEFTAVLSIFVLAMSGICIMISKTFGDKNLDNFKAAISGLMEIVLISGAILLIGGLVMNFIDPLNLIVFGVTLGVFVLLLSGVMFIMSKLDIDKLKTLSQDFGILVMILAGTLIVGSIMTKLVKFEDLFSFTGSLLIFMMLLYLPLKLMTNEKIGKTMFTGAREFGELIFLCGMALALGAAITHFVTFGDLFAFAFNLGVFLVMLSIPLGIIAKGGGKVLMHGAEELGKLVLMSTAALIIGGLFMQIDGLWKESLKFAGILGLFIGLISLAIGLGSMIAGGRGLKFGKELNQLVLISSIVLLIGGGLFMSYPELPKNVLYFGLILGGFISLISIAFGFAGKLLGGKGIAMALALSLVVTISAATLILGPYFIKQAGIDYLDILKFGGTILLFVSLFGIVLGIMGLFAPQIGLGLLCTVGIGLITLGMAWVMQESYKMLSTINWDNFWEQWENVGILFGIIGGVVGILGAIMYTGVGAIILSAGAAALATFEALIYGMGKCVQAAAIGIMYLKNIENEDVEKLMKPFGDFIKYGTEAIWDNLSLKKIAFLKTASGAIKELNKVISQIAKAVQEYAELKVPVYDNSGKLIGYRNLTNQDFTDAATNIATIITCVGGSIMGLFGIGPYGKDMSQEQKEVALEMLKVEPGGLFRGNKTKFGMVVEASEGLGKVIEKIAEGAIKWNKLPKDFDAQKAAINIATIITCVGGSIMGLFNIGPFASGMTEDQKAVAMEMLKVESGSFFGLGAKKTKFGMVVEASEGLGKVIEKIAEGALKYSQLPKDFDVNKISQNVGEIITTIGGAIMTIYNTDIGREMFRTDNIFTGNNKFKRVADSVGQLGEMISNIMEGVQSYANLKIPTKFNEEGKPIDWRPMTAPDFYMAQFNIGKLVTTLGEALTKVAESDIFKSIYGGVQLKNISEAIVNVSKVITPIAESIWMYATGKFPILEYKDGNLVTSGYFDTKKYGGIRKVINVATNNIGLVIKGLAQKIGELLEDDSLEYLYDDAENIKIFTESLSLLTNSVNSIFKILGEILQKPLPSSLISLFITSPLSTFVEGVLFKNKDEKLVEWLIDEYDDELEDYTKALSLLSTTIKTVFGSIKDIIDMNLTNEQVSQIPTMLSSYLSLTNTINGFAAKYTEETSESINRYVEDINKFVELAKNTKEEYAERYNILRDGINAIYSATSLINDINPFKAHTETLERYVEAVNSIQISKVQSLTNLAEAVTKLGDNIGNIDSFTNTLANKVSNVLTNLTKQIKEAEGVIKNADALHKKREELIKKSVGEVTKLMQQDMTVKIEKAEEPNEGTEGGNVGTPETGDENKTTSSSGAGESNNNEDKKSSETTSITQTKPTYKSTTSSVADMNNKLLNDINDYLHKKLGK